MANYAFFRPSNFEETRDCDEFTSAGKAYDLSTAEDNYCKMDIDGSQNGTGHATGLYFLPKSQANCYLKIKDYSGYNISESLPQGAIIVAAECVCCYQSKVSGLGNTPNLTYSVTNGKTDSSTPFYSVGTHSPPKGNTNTTYYKNSGMSSVVAVNETTLNYNTTWFKNNINLRFNVKGNHSTVLSSTVIWLREIYAFCRWKLPFRISIVNGTLAANGGPSLYAYEYNDYVARQITPNSGYSLNNPIITFSQGKPSYTYDSGIFKINNILEGVNVKIEFRKERTINVNYNSGGIASASAEKVPDSSQVTLTATPNPGYRFIQWNDGDTNASRTVTVTSDITYTATFAPIAYYINFNGNGSTSGSMSQLSFLYDDDPYSLTNNNFRKIGYVFKNWNTQANGAGTSFLNQESIKNLTTEHNKSYTLYAQWEFVGDINYENLFSFSQWATSENGQMGSRQTTSELSINIQEGSLTIKDNSGETSPDAYTKYANNTSHYTIPVKSNTKYKFSFNIKQNYSSNDIAQFFVFYYTDTGNASSTHTGWRPILIDGAYTGSFTTPANCTKIGMRFGVYSAYAKITFSNICIYEANQENKIKSITNYKNRDYIPNTSSLLNPNRVGYDFNNWINSSGSTLDLNGIKNSKTSITIYSQWIPYNYYIEFNGNGADNTGTMSTQTFTYDQSKNLTQNGFSRYRYEFVNWNTKADGTGQSYENNSEILNLTAEKNKTVVLYAQWKYAPLGQSVFVKNIPVKKILINSDEVIEVLNNKAVFFRPLKEE